MPTKLQFTSQAPPSSNDGTKNFDLLPFDPKQSLLQQEGLAGLKGSPEELRERFSGSIILLYDSQKYKYF